MSRHADWRSCSAQGATRAERPHGRTRGSSPAEFCLTAARIAPVGRSRPGGGRSRSAPTSPQGPDDEQALRGCFLGRCSMGSGVRLPPARFPASAPRSPPRSMGDRGHGVPRRDLRDRGRGGGWAARGGARHVRAGGTRVPAQGLGLGGADGEHPPRAPRLSMGVEIRHQAEGSPGITSCCDPMSLFAMTILEGASGFRDRPVSLLNCDDDRACQRFRP